MDPRFPLQIQPSLHGFHGLPLQESENLARALHRARLNSLLHAYTSLAPLKLFHDKLNQRAQFFRSLADKSAFSFLA